MAQSYNSIIDEVWFWPGDGELEEVEGGPGHGARHRFTNQVYSSNLAEI